MSGASAFLSGASGRLLAASIPFRFFASAVLFHLLGWLVLLYATPSLADFAGGLGWTLTALHLFTLGVLLMTAIGASLQLLPVATRQPVTPTRWPYDLLWSSYTLGVLAVVIAMALAEPGLLWVGALLLAAALLFYLALLLRNLKDAKGMGLVVTHGWAAGLSLLVLLGSALSLAAAYSGIILIDRASGIGLHVGFAAYGFMGLLVMGFSYILVPMFALADNPAPVRSRLSLALALGGLLLTLALMLGWLPMALSALAPAAALVSLLVHLVLMEQALRTGMRRHLGSSFVLVRIGWAMLAASLALALLLELGVGVARAPALLGLLLIGGLLTLLLGMLSRIVPFLAAMHAGVGMRRPPTPSNLTQQGALDIHLYAHSAALVLLLLGVGFGSLWLLRLAALLGAVGAGAYAFFFGHAWRRMTELLKKNGKAPNS